MFYKPEIRRRIRNRRKQLTPEAIKIASDEVAAKLIHIPELIDSEDIAYYISNEGELDPTAIITRDPYQNKSFYLPASNHGEHKTLAFYPFSEGDTLIENTVGILEPQTNSKKLSSTSRT